MPKMPTKDELPREIAIPPVAASTPGSMEVLRAWIVQNGLQVTLAPAFQDPGMWGMLLVDVARHAARAYAAEGICSEEEAMRQIRKVLDVEIKRPTDPGKTEKLKKL